MKRKIMELIIWQVKQDINSKRSWMGNYKKYLEQWECFLIRPPGIETFSWWRLKRVYIFYILVWHLFAHFQKCFVTCGWWWNMVLGIHIQYMCFPLSLQVPYAILMFYKVHYKFQQSYNIIYLFVKFQSKSVKTENGSYTSRRSPDSCWE